MCINCLNIKLEQIGEYEKEVSELKDTLNCECCVSYLNLLLNVNNDLKILCLTKIKKQGQICPNVFLRLDYFESMVKQRIKNKLNDVIGMIYDEKENMKEHMYLKRMNNLKQLNDFVAEIDEADHN
jgi:hypothetical protein